ncbi:hypothetical protein OV320_1239 [Actinobacteria bacterium OV320]|nr:hypothetical protein OV320_1239 [Actinobacteria bacterium OV320]
MGGWASEGSGRSPGVGDGFEPLCKLYGGNQQKVVLSKWIFAGPDLLILGG